MAKGGFPWPGFMRRLFGLKKGVGKVMMQGGSVPEHFMFFRFAEVCLIFEWVGGGVPQQSLDGAALATACADLPDPVPLASQPYAMRGDVGSRRPILIERGGTVCLFQTVNLGSWQANLEDINSTNTHILHQAHIQPIRDVPVAVKRLNDNAAGDNGERITIDNNWRLWRATPNWTAVPFSDVEAGNPGGRPVRPDRAKWFRPDANSSQVPNAVAECLAGQPLDGPISSTTPGGVQVAVLDTWPMKRQDGLTCGANPQDPFDRINEFIGTHPGANDYLRRAGDGKLVFKERIFDFVSCQSKVTVPVAHFNGDLKEHEPGYDVSDHGLFIVGMIKDIAPDAIVSLYRVLADDGSGDLDTIVRALELAIEEARGQPLIINMSLGVAPPLVAIKALLDLGSGVPGQPAVDLQRAQEWRDLVAALARTAQDFQNNGLLDAERLEADGLVVRHPVSNKVTGLTDVLEAIDYFFRLPANRNVLVVASAGNDSWVDGDKTIKFGPRLPAAVEGVLGVSAAGARYSNRDDIENDRDDGVSAPGGGAGNDQATARMVTENGIVGLGIVPRLSPGDLPATPQGAGATPGGPHDNENGWIEWSGTSFAAPVVTGLAACIWAEASSLSPTQVYTAITGIPSNHREVLLSQQ